MKCTHYGRLMAIALGLLAVMPAGAMPLPAEADHVISLNGVWRFKLERLGPVNPHPTAIPPIIELQNPEPFEKPDYKEDASWHDMKVPSNWEMVGYSPATYWQPDNAIGIYRLEFDVPADWKDRNVLIDFDGVQNGAEVYLNGQPVEVHEPSWGRKNYHEGGFNPFQVDLTPAVKFGEKNLLAVRVYKNTKSADMDSGDFFFLGGIYRNVRLFSVPKICVNDLTVRTNLLPNDKAEVHVIFGLDNGGKSQATVTLEGLPPMPMQGNEAVITVDNPKLWSAEKPNLYNLSVELKDEAGNVTEHLTKRIGIREVSIKDGVLMVNNQPVKLAGMCRHEHWATLGGWAPGLDQWRKDIELMKAANINAIRTSHYPYGSGFYDLCDEMGMYVADEMAACWVRTDTDDLTPAFAQHAREFVQRDKNHPSIIIWAIGNENKPGKNNKVSADEIRKIDPTRPRLVSIQPANNADVEMDDNHYVSPTQIAKDQASPRRARFPMIYLENPNVWDIRNGADFGADDEWGLVMLRQWQEIFKDNHIPGTFLWEWQDRAVTDLNPTKFYNFYPATGINVVKVKGLVDAFRNPRPALYSVKVAGSPVQVDVRPVMERNSVKLHAKNYYSFTNFSELKTSWELLAGEQSKAKGDAHFDVAPMNIGDIQVDLPAEAMASADVLRLTFDWPDGRNVITFDIHIKTEADKTPAHSANLEGVNFPRFNFTTTDMVDNTFGWQGSHRHPGKLINLTVTSSKGSQKLDEAALYSTPLAEVQSIDADIEMDVAPMAPAGKDGKPRRPGEAEMSKAKAENVGHVHAEFKDGKFSYKLTWKGSHAADVQELGWKFAMPKSCDHFSWHRQALWSYYPPNQIGRPQGTATPDTANQELTNMKRVDAFDFVSSKYHCDWASLGDQQGHGIVVMFDPKGREQCRGGIVNDGYELVVNKQSSPPEDMCSGLVPEFYLKIAKGASAHAEFTVGSLQK